MRARRTAIRSTATGPRARPAVASRPRAGALHDQRSNQALQAKLAVGRADDPLEHEADRAADRVLAGGSSGPLGSAPAQAQRRCAACEAEDDATLQRDAEGPASTGAPGAARAAADAVAQGGRPLPSALRAYFEPRFGRDLSGVRIHDDPQAQAAAASVQAHAFTLGRDIAFAAGQYAPGSVAGLRLLAHELAHVAQQRAGDGGPGLGDGVLRRQQAPAFPARGMKIIGSDAADLVAILSRCTGYPLGLDANQVLERYQGPPNAAGSTAPARNELDRLLGLNVGVVIDTNPANPAVGIGAFSHANPGYQQIDVANVRVAAGAGGVGGGLDACSAVLHEISEAFTGRQLSIGGKVTGQALFTQAHAQGTAVENQIRTALGLPLRQQNAGALVMLGIESGTGPQGQIQVGTRILFLESTVFGQGQQERTQLNLVRLVVQTVSASGNVEGDNNTVASTVAQGSVTFRTRRDAILVFNRFAAQLGFAPMPVPQATP
jgi:hypothetical protein